MATTKTMSARFDVSPEQLLTLLTDREFLVAQQKLDPAAIEVSVDELSRSDDCLVLELRATQYGRGMLGVDRSKTERSVTTYTWDLRRRRCEWLYHGPHSERFSATGSDRIEADGDGSRFTTEFRLEIRVPLIGNKIEKLVLKQFEARQPKYERLVREFCRRRYP